MARVVVDVMPKPEILDPQGKAVTSALARMGFAGLQVRQGKRFEVEIDGDVTDERLGEITRAAELLLANTVIESFEVRVQHGTGLDGAPLGALAASVERPVGATGTQSEASVPTPRSATEPPTDPGDR